MKNTKAKISRTLTFVSAAALLVGCLNVGKVVTHADEIDIAPELYYCDDADEETSFAGGENSHVDATFEIEYDTKQVIDKAVLPSAPSYGYAYSDRKNMCSPVAGANIVGYYDQWYTDLIPNFTPGMTSSSGKFMFFPDLGTTQVKNTIIQLYDLMKTNVGGGGTTESNFKSGLVAYFNNAGLSCTYSSFYKNTTSVNLQTLKTAVNQKKVGVLLCSHYNFVSGIMHLENEPKTAVVKENSAVGHTMMVYGYQTIAYYKDGQNFRTDTFLYVSSGYSSSEQGYILMEDYLKIENALIVSVS